MKLKEGFLLRTVAGENVAVPTGEHLEGNMMITLNDTGRLLWERLEKGAELQELVAALLEKYEVDEATARSHTDAFVAALKKHGFLEQ